MVANPPNPRPNRRRTYQRRIWSCGYCNTQCKTVLGPVGLCALCRQQQPSLFDAEDPTASNELRGRT
jgi:hypothetical protein